MNTPTAAKASPQRSVTLSVKVTPEEQRILRVAAAKRNVGIGEYLRQIALPKAEREAAA